MSANDDLINWSAQWRLQQGVASCKTCGASQRNQIRRHCLYIWLDVGMQAKAHGLGMNWTVSPLPSGCGSIDKVELSNGSREVLMTSDLKWRRFHPHSNTSGELEGEAIELN